MRLLLIEDHPRLRELVADSLRSHGFAVDTAGDVEGAEATLAVVRPDVIVLDLRLPDGDGMEVLRRIRARGNATPIIILTARDAVEDRVAGLNAGADDYLIKPFSNEELVARVKALLRRPHLTLNPILRAGNLTLDTGSRTVAVESVPVRLGRRETGLLESLLRSRGQVVLKASLLESLYGFNEEVTENALEAAISRLRRGLVGSGSSATIHTLRGVGYMIAERSPTLAEQRHE